MQNQFLQDQSIHNIVFFHKILKIVSFKSYSFSFNHITINIQVKACNEVSYRF